MATRERRKFTPEFKREAVGLGHHPQHESPRRLLGQLGSRELLCLAQRRSGASEKPIRRATTPASTSSITSRRSTIPGVATRRSGKSARWSSNELTSGLSVVSGKPGEFHWLQVNDSGQACSPNN